MNSIIWIIVLAIFILIEIMTLGITTIWFAGGALVSFIVSLFYDNLALEIILFLSVSLVLFYFTRPIVMNYLHSGDARSKYDGVIGKEALVVAIIDNSSAAGRVQVDGQEWSARSMEGNIIEKDCRVTIRGISGAKLVVAKVQGD